MVRELRCYMAKKKKDNAHEIKLHSNHYKKRKPAPKSVLND